MLGGGGGLMSTMATGMAFGAGSEVGHQAVRSMMGGGSSGGHGGHEPAAAGNGGYAEQPPQTMAAPAEQPALENPCNGFSSQLMQCMQVNRGDIGIC